MKVRLNSKVEELDGAKKEHEAKKKELQEFIAGSQLQIGERVLDAKREERSVFDRVSINDDYTRWSDYALKGGSNYRELVFTIPKSSYTNEAMQNHWGDDAEGVLAHARIQDFIVNGKKYTAKTNKKGVATVKVKVWMAMLLR